MPILKGDLHGTNQITKQGSDPIFKKTFTEQILSISFSTYEWSQDIICIVFSNKIQIGQINVQDEIEIQTIGEFNHPVHCNNIALSPITSLAVLPKVIQFSTSGNDFKIRVYKSDLAENSTCQILSGHFDFINDLSYDSESNCLASTADDQTARIWDTETGACLCTFHLQSPGMAVCWHADDSAKLMICEKRGLIRFYNVQSQQPILSLDNAATVSYAHWNPSDSQLVGALTKGELKLWDLTRPSQPARVKAINVEDGGNIKFNQEGNMIAVINPLSFNLKVMHLQNNQMKLNVPVLLPTNVSWHFRLPIVCVGDDRHLCFYKIDPN